MKKSEMLTPERLRELLSYDPTTGVFIWVARGRGIRTGREAGYIDPNSYRYIRIDGVDYLAQRLAWFWVHGEWPKRLLRFQDGNSRNCAIDNLREGFFIATKHNHATKEGRAAYQLEYRTARRQKFRDEARERKYGLAASEYNAMIAAQNNKCAICRKEETEMRGATLRALAVDHNHKTGKVRELLCTACNKLIGLANEDRDVLLAALRYLDKHADGANVVPLKEAS